ncbi:hypothetical protein MHM98_05925 [Psychrobium sp. MM17-31]|uniref:hypothetical protein n=1 Tax=Psychrobium sp. MM17-31 TaxID=2917758 RepID=UPI001EF6C411|nr:hypothetical protein [Psychrobium sp. MM17-31]MCG7530894.1 hypothetical protein [Psychrobium sp. MM17-31]
MNNFSKSALAIALSSTLIACGGGSDSGSGDSLKPPTTYTFTLNAKTINKCGVEQPVANADFYLQDSEWALVSSHQTDANGQISITTTDKTINYTIAKEQLNNGNVANVELRSFIDVNSASQATVVFENPQLSDDSSCQCQTQDLDLSYSLVSSVDKLASSAAFASAAVIDASNARFSDVEVCRESDKAWPNESFMVVATNSQDNLTAFSGFSNSFDATPGENWRLNTNAIAIALDVDHTKLQQLTTAQLIDNKLHFDFTAKQNDSQTIVFDNHAQSDNATYYGQAVNVHQESVSIVGKVIVKSFHTRLSAQYEDTVALTPALEAPVVDTVIFSEVSADGSYDYSKVDGYSAIHFTTKVNADHPQSSGKIPTTWHVYGPMAGKLPVADTLEKYSYIKRDIATIETLHVEMFASDSASSYDSFINAFSKGSAYQTSGVLSNYRTHLLELEK